jgi:hypothetical protein
MVCALSMHPARCETRTDVRFIPVYFSGDFGSDVQTDILYLPFIFTARTEASEFRITLPFLSIRTDEPVTFAGGEVIRRGAGNPATESGPGDLVVQGERFFVQGDERRPWISGIFRLKVPTADESRGLGTGEFDYGPGAAILQPAGRSLSLFGQALYVVRGDPAGADFRNTLWISAGAQRTISESSSFSLSFEDRQSVVRGRREIRDLSLGYDRRLSPAITLRSALFVGLSDTAEDWGFSAGLSARLGPGP